MVKSPELSKVFNRASMDLPLAVYTVLPNGSFAEANERARELLNLPPTGTIKANIRDFYTNPRERESFLFEVEESGSIGNRLVQFKVGSQIKFLKLTCKPVISESRKHEGYIGCLVDVTEEEKYKNLVEHLPAGIYQLDENDVITRANDAFARLHGFPNSNSILGTPITNFIEERDAIETRKLIETEGKMFDKRLCIRRKDGARLVASVTAIARRGVDGEYCGREGTILDVTAEEGYRNIIQDLPLGFYKVKKIKGMDVLIDCNEQFLKIHELESIDDIPERNINELHFSPEESKKFLQQVKLKAVSGAPVLGWPLRISMPSGRVKTLEINTRAEFLDGEVIGRIGVVRDITEEEDNREQVAVFTHDIGRVLHVFSQTLMQQSLILGSLEDGLGPDPFQADIEPSQTEVQDAVKIPEGQLIGSLRSFLDRVKGQVGLRGIAEETHSRLSFLCEYLSKYKDKVRYKEFLDSTLMDTATEIRRLAENLKSTGVPRVLQKEVVRSAREITRILSLAAIRQSRETQLAVDHEVNTLREYVTFKVRREEAWKDHSFAKLTRIALENMKHFALFRRVELRFRDYSKEARIRAKEREIVRAIGSLLHNSIKYSWFREAGNSESTWVNVVIEVEQEFLVLSIQNFGVPIPQDEIELVYDLGFRGRLSSDRGRVGTGIGLTDAMDVVYNHDGELNIESVPANPHTDPSDLDAPFLTTATLRIRRKRQETT